MRKYTFFSLSALVLTTLATLAAPVDLRQGLVAYWPLDGTADGLTTPDLSPFANHLDLVNMDTANFVPGKRGNAAQFNGTDEILRKIYTPGPNVGFPVSPSRRFTVAFWVNGVGSTQGNRRVFSEGSTTAAAQLFNIGTDSATTGRTNVVDIFIRNDANTAVVSHRKSTNMVYDGTWHHVAFVQNDSVVRLYIDGVADPADFSYAASAMTFTAVSVGGIQRAAPGSYFAGLVDEAAVWERPLSQAEVQDLMNNGLTTPIPEYPPVVLLDPVGATIPQGDNYTFRSLASGNRPVSYQWMKDGAPILGATGPNHTVANASATDNGIYSVDVSNLEGTASSATATLVVQADPPANLTAGLISYWPLDTVDNTLLTTPDLYSQNNFALTLMNSFDLVPGNTGLSNALHFDGSSQYAQRVGGFPAYSSPTHSIAFWVKGDGLTQLDARVYGEGSTSTTTPLFTLGTVPTTAGTGLRVFIRNDANATSLAAISSRPVFDNNWHHVVWSDSNGNARVYIDGVLDPVSFRYTRSQVTLNTSALGGIVRATVGSFCNSSMDEVAVWNRAITYTEVQALYTGRIPPPITIIAPDITKNPKGADVFEGTDVTLTVEAIGTALKYKWLKNGTPVTDATNSVLLLASARAADSGSYTVEVSNSAGTKVSTPATVVVTTITDATTGLVAYWPLDQVTDSTTPDTTVNGNHLTLVNMDSSNVVPGRRGNALSFNGVDELAMRDHTAGSVGLPIFQHSFFTVAMWVNGVGNAQPTTPVNGDKRVYSEGSTTNNSALFNIGTDNANGSLSVDMFIRDDAGATPINHLKSGNVAFDGAWHHVVYVDRNGAGSIYVDGVLDATAINYTRTDLIPNNTSIGGIVRAAQSHWFLGQLDDVAVWRRALSDTEISYVMNHGAVPPPPLKIDQIEVTDSFVTLTFTVPDPLQFYCIKQATDLTLKNWTEVTDFVLVGPTENTYQAKIPRDAGAVRFYQVYPCP